jgi:hypothetical protein
MKTISQKTGSILVLAGIGLIVAGMLHDEKGWYTMTGVIVIIGGKLIKEYL